MFSAQSRIDLTENVDGLQVMSSESPSRQTLYFAIETGPVTVPLSRAPLMAFRTGRGSVGLHACFRKCTCSMLPFETSESFRAVATDR